MRAIRPFALYQHFLHSTPEDQGHETVRNALRIMASVNVVGNVRLSGEWPKQAIISCLGLYIGAEYLSVGDTVRLIPELLHGEEENADILHIHRIEYHFVDMTEDDPLRNSTIRLVGQAFTVNELRSVGQARRAELPSILHSYDGPVYWRHDSREVRVVPLGRIIGRAFESEAVDSWLPGSDDPLQFLTAGKDGIEAARVYARQEVTRIAAGKKWSPADDRLEALDVQSLNGVSSWRYDNLRKDRLEAGHKAAKVLNRPIAQSLAEMRAVAERPKAQGDAFGMQRAKASVR